MSGLSLVPIISLILLDALILGSLLGDSTSLVTSRVLDKRHPQGEHTNAQ